MPIEIEHRLTAVEDLSEDNRRRITEVEKRQENLDKLVSTVGVLADREKRVEDDVKEIKSDVKSLTEQPGKRWNGLIDKIVWAIAAAVIAFLLGRIGL